MAVKKEKKEGAIYREAQLNGQKKERRRSSMQRPLTCGVMAVKKEKKEQYAEVFNL